jgi:hypothetical protein
MEYQNKPDKILPDNFHNKTHELPTCHNQKLKSTINVLAPRTKIQTFTGKQDSSIQTYPKTDLDVWNSALGMYLTIEHKSTSTIPIKRTALHNQYPMVCFKPHTAQRSSYSVHHRRNKEIFHHISQPDRLCGLVVRGPGSIPGATRFSE